MNLNTLIKTEEATIVDVREPGEFKTGHIKGSINLPLSGLMQQVGAYRNFSQPLIVVCRSGNRSGIVTQFLRAQGLKEVYNGGAWYAVDEMLSRKAA